MNEADAAGAGGTTTRVDSSSSTISNHTSSNHGSISSRSSSPSSSYHHSNSNSSRRSPTVGVVGLGAECYSSGALEAEGLVAWGAEEGIGVVGHKKLGVGREVCFRTPPIAAASWRCQHCNELGYVHQECAWRVDPCYPVPPGAVPPFPRGTAPGGASHPSYATPDRQQQWSHSYGQANINAAATTAACTDAPHGYGPNAAAAVGDDSYYHYYDYGGHFYE